MLKLREPLVLLAEVVAEAEFAEAVRSRSLGSFGLVTEREKCLERREEDEDCVRGFGAVGWVVVVVAVSVLMCCE